MFLLCFSIKLSESLLIENNIGYFLTNTINLKVHSASKLAKEKIEKAGGTVEIIEV